MKYALILALGIYATATAARDKAGVPVVITTAKGDKITMTAQKERPVNVVNKQEARVMMSGEERPDELNGRKIYYYKDHPTDEFTFAATKIWTDDYKKLMLTIDEAIKQETAQLEKGYYEYVLKNIVIDEKGYIVYYESGELKGYVTPGLNHLPRGHVDVPEAVAISVDKKIKDIISNFRYTPFIYHGTATPFLNSYTHYITVGRSKLPEAVTETLQEAIKENQKKALQK